MNTITGVIKNIEAQGNISIVSVQVGSCVVDSIVLEKESESTFIILGNKLNVLFKETEVVLGLDIDEKKLSIENFLPCRVHRIQTGKLLANITLLFDEIEINSIITMHAFQKLDLKKDDNVVAMVKMNEIMLAPC